MRAFAAGVAILVALLIPVAASADSVFFEFNPDFVQNLFAASSPQPVEQLFLPLNDHISAIDFWMSNNDNPGPATFELFSPSGTLLATRTVSLPAIPDSLSGSRTKVSLPVQIATVANQAYAVRISTAAPSLRLYHAEQQKILAHNAVPQAAYTGGLARINGEDKGFSFTFALYESSESSPPVISNLSVTVVSVQQVRLSFNASEPVDATVTYGLQSAGQGQSVPYSGQYTSCPAGIQQCTLLLDVPATGTTYDFTLTVKDVWGNTAQTTGTFTTAGVSVSPTPASPTPTPTSSATPAPTPDASAPVITNARAVNLTHESVGIAWTTSEAANSLVVIQFGADKITAGGGSDSTLELEHLVAIAGLGPLTPYTVRILSADASGNETTTEFEFSTAQVPTPGPSPGASPTVTPSAPTPIPTVSIGPTDQGDGQEASWSEPASGAPSGGYRIDIIGADGQLIRTILTGDTSAALGDLPQGARVIVYADHGDGVFEKVAPAAGQKRPLLEFSRLAYLVGGLGAAVIIGGFLRRRLRTLSAQKPEPVPGQKPPDLFVSYR